MSRRVRTQERLTIAEHTSPLDMPHSHTDKSSSKRIYASFRFTLLKHFRLMAFAFIVVLWTVFFWTRTYDFLATDMFSDPPFQSLRAPKEKNEEAVHSRVVMYVHNETDSRYRKVHPDVMKHWLPKQRSVSWLGDRDAQEEIRDDDTPPFEEIDKDCTLRYDWQRTTHPTCNILHEFDLTTPWSTHGGRNQKRYRIVGNGYWRDVWIVNEQLGGKGVFKSMRWDHDYTHRNFDRMRRDALTMERMTASKFIIDIYSFCGTSSMSEYGDGGDIPAAIWPAKGQPELTQIEKLRIGRCTTYRTDSMRRTTLFTLRLEKQY